MPDSKICCWFIDYDSSVIFLKNLHDFYPLFQYCRIFGLDLPFMYRRQLGASARHGEALLVFSQAPRYVNVRSQTTVQTGNDDTRLTSDYGENEAREEYDCPALVLWHHLRWFPAIDCGG